MFISSAAYCLLNFVLFYQRTDLTLLQHKVVQHRDSNRFRSPHQTLEEGVNDYAVYLNGSAGLRLSTPKWHPLVKNMRFAFTLEIWILIEGGQPDSATIIALKDICGKEKGETTWKISISGERGACLVVAITPELAPESYHIRSAKTLRIDEWIQIVLAFDLHQLLLYVNGARVARMIREFGVLYSETRSGCKRLYLATDRGQYNQDEIVGFRGFIDKLHITDHFMSHSELFTSMKRWKGNVFEENFSDTHHWKPIGNELGIRMEEISARHKPLNVKIPQCGRTVCDNPIIARNYLLRWDLHAAKKLKYRVVIISEDDGSNPNMRIDIIMRQHEELLKAFAPHNITWDLEVVNVRNTSLRHKTIVFGCHSSAIGNKRCDIECRHPITGDDGGDCKLQAKCEKWMIGNKKCDLECNNRENNWDNDECCTNYANSDNHFCINPNSIYRRYINVEEYKTAVGIDNENKLTVQFGDWIASDLVGFSTFPWEKDIYSEQGGILLRYDRFGVPGQISHLIHEIGHVLGLWHVHHGVTEVPCGDPCQEIEPSMVTGDMVSDTNPTVKNTACADPDAANPCDGTFRFKNTPFRNYMSYTGDNCANTFTPQQTARMHCYIDLKYTKWIERPTPVPSHIVIGPRILPSPEEVTSKSVTIMWTSPLSDRNCGPRQKRVQETHCTTDGRVVQYALSATSSEPFQMSGFWGPEQATGAPDAEACTASTKAWLPDVQDCDDVTDICILKLRPDVETQLEKLSLWFAWNAASGVRFVKIIFTDSTFDIFEQVQIRTSNPFVSIDAVQFISPPLNPLCSHCLPHRYRIYRTPPFSNGFRETINHYLIDSTVKEGVSYSYSVAVESGGIEGLHSPSTAYSLNMNVCGDGIRGTDEECDDGNLNDWDGCSHYCTVEENFHCTEGSKMSRSICYVYEGDGECELFERNSYSQDCNSVTATSSYSQHYPTSVYAYSITLQQNCSLHLLSFASLTIGCNVRSSAWGPCSPLVEAGEISLHAAFPSGIFPASIFIGFATAVSTGFRPLLSTVRVNLQYINKTTINLEEQRIISCAQNPLEIPIPHTLVGKLSSIKAAHIYVSNPTQIIITSIILQTSNMFDLLTIQTCAGENKYFDPLSGSCVTKNCRSISTFPCTPMKIPKSRHKCHGATCIYTCEAGFMFRNSQRTAVLLCSNGGWVGSSDLNCIPIHCPAPKIEHADIDCPNGTHYLNQCTFRCRNYAILIGNVNHIRCEENGLWTIPEAFCQVVCPHEGLLARNISQHSINCKANRVYDTQTYHPISTICRLSCRRHYRASYGQSLHTRIRVVCSDNGVWVGPTCIPITCPSPKILYVGSYNCTNGFNVGSSCQFRCPGTAQYRYSLCKKDGSWSNRFLCPSPRASCLSPPSMRDIQFTCPRRLIPGATCSAQCRKKGYDAVLEENQILPSGDKLLVYRGVVNISCTVSSVFHPQVDALSCIRSCNKEFMGDGWCDFQNNRGYCGWDGGDCCASTVRGGKVRLMFPSLCTSLLCQCIDPFAIENSASSISGTDGMTSMLSERKAAKKRTTPYGQRHAIMDPVLYSSTDTPDTSPRRSINIATHRYQKDLYYNRLRSSSQQRDKVKIAPSKRTKEWEVIARSVKDALEVHQRQFYNKV